MIKNYDENIWWGKKIDNKYFDKKKNVTKIFLTVKIVTGTLWQKLFVTKKFDENILWQTKNE